MLLNDIQIKKLVEEHNMISPFQDFKTKEGLSFGLEPSGYTLRLDNKFKVLNMKNVQIDPCVDQEFLYSTCIREDYFILQPQSRVLCQVMEQLNIPSFIACDLWPKSSYLRAGIVPHLALVEPGWRGHLTIEVFNTNPFPARMHVGQGLVQARFHMISSAENGYDGHYQDLTSPKSSMAQ